MVEAKEFHVMKYLKKRFCNKVLPFTKNAVDSVDLEIKSVFGENSKQIITPDLVRGDHKTLNEAILKNNWPLLSDARGKIIFVFMASEKAKENYLDGHFSLEKRMMFIYSKPGNPEAAFIKLEKPEKQFSEIQKLVKQGYFIRTRADANTKESRKNNYNRMNKSLESGAQLIATDYYMPDPRNLDSKKWSDYTVKFPHGFISRKNPLNSKFIIDSLSSKSNFIYE